MATSIKDHKTLGRKGAKLSELCICETQRSAEAQSTSGTNTGANQLSAGHPAGVPSHGLALTGKVLIGALRPQRSQIRGQQSVISVRHPEIV